MLYGDPPNNWKIPLPKSLLQPTFKCFHQVTGHPGRQRLFMQISSWYYHRDFWSLVDKFHCKHCQRNNLYRSGTGYGLLPEHELCSVPFKECAVDLIGPWIIQVRNKLYEFNDLTVIDTVSNLVELVRVDEKMAAHVSRKYAQVWLSRYPWPECCVHNNGGEFLGPEFQFHLQGCRIKDALTPSKKSTSQCNLWADASNGRKCSTNSSTRWTSTRCYQSKRIHRWSAIDCNTRHAYRHPYHLRK